MLLLTPLYGNYKKNSIMLKNKTSKFLVTGGMALVGLVAGIATIAGAQTTTTATPSTLQSQAVTTTSTQGDVADATESKTKGHAPLGGDGVVSSINGTTIVIGEESDEGGASYTIDASKATITNNGAGATISDIKVGQKIFVVGATSGTGVTATSISIGHHGEHADQANDADGGAISETSEGSGSGDIGE